MLPEVSNFLGDKRSHHSAARSFGSEKQDGWSAVSKEAEALLFLDETAACYSKAKTSSKGITSVFSNSSRLSFLMYEYLLVWLKELGRHVQPFSLLLGCYSKCFLFLFFFFNKIMYLCKIIINSTSSLLS